MACRLFGAKRLSEPMQTDILSIRSQGTYFNEMFCEIQKFAFKSLENALENVVWEMAATLSRPQCAKRDLSKARFCFHWYFVLMVGYINSSSPEQNGRHFGRQHFQLHFLNENDIILIQIWLKYVPRSPIDNNPALVQVMAWRRTGDKPLPEPNMTQFTDAYKRH